MVRIKLSSPLETLGRFCISASKHSQDVFDNSSFDFKNSNVKYPLFEKLIPTWEAFDNGLRLLRLIMKTVPEMRLI